MSHRGQESVRDATEGEGGSEWKGSLSFTPLESLSTRLETRPGRLVLILEFRPLRFSESYLKSAQSQT